MSSTFCVRVGLSSSLSLDGAGLTREEFYAWVWRRFGSAGGLTGVHEGTVLSEEAVRLGLETDSWTIDQAQAPRQRDWVLGLSGGVADLYFSSREAAEQAIAAFAKVSGLSVYGSSAIKEVEAQDWDAKWKASFVGVDVAPFWKIRPPWVAMPSGAQLNESGVWLRINPGAGFGTGTHETTQLCLRALGALACRIDGCRVLDFGSGSGILAIGAALLGAKVDAVEVDELANDNAHENAKLNGVAGDIRFLKEIPVGGDAYDIVLANILRPVLLEFAPLITPKINKAKNDNNNGVLILSGLIESDVKIIEATYSALLGGRSSKLTALAEWRALVF